MALSMAQGARQPMLYALPMYSAVVFDSAPRAAPRLPRGRAWPRKKCPCGFQTSSPNPSLLFAPFSARHYTSPPHIACYADALAKAALSDAMKNTFDSITFAASVGDPERVAAVLATGLLDTPAEAAFDRHARLARRLLHVAASFVSLVDDRRVFFKSAIASAEALASMPREVPIADSFCPYPVAASAPLIVSDSRIDPRFTGHSAVRNFNLIAYAGVPLVSAEGHTLGTFCVIDGQPRAWTDDDISTLTDLAAAVMTEIELRQRVLQLETSQARLGEARSLAEQRYAELRAVYASAPVGLAFVDVDLRFVTINETLAFINGRSVDDHIGKSLREVLPAALYDVIEPYYRRALAGERVEEIELRGPNPTNLSEFRDWLLSYIPISNSDGQVLGINIVVRDITQQKRAEQAVRSSEVQYRTLFNSIDQGFSVIEMLFDKNGKPNDYRFLECNPMFEGLTGLTNAVGKTARELLPGLEARWFEIYREVAVTGAAVRFVDGSDVMNRWFDVYAFRVGGPESRKVAILFTNITERKRLENERERHIAALQEADHRKDEFLAMLAHELRNPLAPICNALEIMKRRDISGDILERVRSMMERQLSQLVHLVDDLLDVSRISRGTIELRKGRTELASVVSHAVEAASPLSESMGQELSVVLPPHPIYLDGDFHRLAQVVGNMLNNAAKYTAKGGSIWLITEQESDQAVIRVRDTGIGIGADQLPLIFDMFKQVDPSLERSQGGLGIGLTLVKKLVAMHGGTVEAHSAGVGQGSEFIVRLPVMLGRPEPLAPEPRVRYTQPTAGRF